MIAVLGPLRVIDATGNDVTPRGAQQRRALTALAVVAPDPVSIDQLVDVLWPAGAPSSNAVQAQISKLRKVVAPATIESDASGYRLVGADTDLGRFRSHVAAGELDAAHELVRGRPLADLDDDWGDAHRLHIEAAVRAAAIQRLERLVAVDPDLALAELERRVLDDPLDERWWALLMTAHARAGRQAEALRTYGRARTVLAEELGIDPGPELRLIEQDVLQQRESVAPPHAARVRRPLPAQLSSVVGRDDFLEQLADLAGSERLVTIVGPGGAGKTTTARLLARARSGDGGAAWCELAPVDDRDGVVRQLTRALGMPESELDGLAGRPRYDEPIDRLVDALAAAPVTLVLDNCEHVIDAAAEITHRVLAGAPDVHVVATSREPLGVPGERVVPLPPLRRSDAVELLVDRAKHHGVGAAALTDAGLLDAICARLDDLPLAIELAAARLRAMTPAELHDGLDDRFVVLDAGPRTADPRQRTLWAVVDWSFELLDASERHVLQRLAVFAGGASVDGIAAVAGGAEVADVANVVGRLVDKSLVVASPSPWGMRFDLLDTIRAYAAARLSESGDRETALAAHARFVADLVAPARLGLVGHDQTEWFGRLELERGNVDAALSAAIGQADGATALAIVAPLSWYFYMLGELMSTAQLLGDVLALPGSDDPDQRALTLSIRAWLLVNGPEVQLSRAVSAEAVALLPEVADPWVHCIVCNNHVMVTLFSGRLDLLPPLVERARAAAAAVDDEWSYGITKLVEGEAHEFSGRMREAADAFAVAARHFEACGDRFASALTISEEAELAEQFGEYDRAVAVLEDGLRLADEVGFSGHPLAMRARLGNLEILRGDLEAAEAHHRHLLGDGAAAGLPWLATFSHWGLSAIARRRGDFDLAARELDLAWAEPRSQRVPYIRNLIRVAQGYLADQVGDGETALARQYEGLESATAIGSPLQIAFSLEGCAGALALHDDPAAARLAAALLGHADHLRRRFATAMPAAERYDVDRAEERLRGRLEGAFDAEFSAGAEAELDHLRRSLDRFARSLTAR